MSWLRAGRVGRPHGLDGSFHVADALAPLLSLGMTVFTGGEEHEITRRAGTDARPIIRLAGMENRSAAQTLRGVDLLCPRERAPELEEDEWWASDLEGLRVVADGHLLGRVRRLDAFPSCDALTVCLDDGTDDLLVPLVKDAVRRVDVEHGEIEVELQFIAAEVTAASGDAPPA